MQVGLAQRVLRFYDQPKAVVRGAGKGLYHGESWLAVSQVSAGIEEGDGVAPPADRGPHELGVATPGDVGGIETEFLRVALLLTTRERVDDIEFATASRSFNGPREGNDTNWLPRARCGDAMQSDVGRGLGLTGEDVHLIARSGEAAGGLPGHALDASCMGNEALDRERDAQRLRRLGQRRTKRRAPSRLARRAAAATADAKPNECVHGLF